MSTEKAPGKPKDEPKKEKEEKIGIRIVGPSGEATRGELSARRWGPREATRRAGRLSLKILGAVFCLCFCALFVHILILPALTSLTCSLIALPIVFFYFRSQKMTFSSATGHCPHCGTDGELKRYLWASVQESITLLCPRCGQTSKALLEPGSWSG